MRPGYLTALLLFGASLFLALPPHVQAGSEAQPAASGGSQSMGSVGEERPEAGGRGWLGVFIQPLTPDLAAALGISETRGVLISQVLPGGPAQAGGIRSGDVVLSLDGRKTAEARDLAWLVGEAGAGSTVRLVLLRRGKRLTKDLTLGRAPKKPPATAKTWDYQTALGLTVAGPESDLFKKYFDSQPAGAKRPAGVAAAKVEENGLAHQAGLRAGDVILEAGQKPCPNLVSFKAIMAGVTPGEKLLLLVSRQGRKFYLALKTKP